MLIIPAIDLRGGRVVRLFRGKYDEETVYSEDPEGIARGFEEQGARLIHVVDLDGARSGRPENLRPVEAIAKAVKIPVELGGGIRTRETAAEVLKRGVRRIVIGTKAIDDGSFIRGLVREFGEKVVAGVDAAGDRVRAEGWTKETEVSTADLLRRLETDGVRTVIYTDISRDGTLAGPNIDGLEKAAGATRMKMVASGGVSSNDDLRKISALEEKGIVGAIVGKALYERKIDLREAIEAFQK